MSSNISGNTWQENPADIIILVNKTSHNYMLELPTGRYRLDAGRRMRTMRSIMNIPQVKELVDNGSIVIES
jgi:hypothetical protein